MPRPSFAILVERGLIAVTGDDRRPFLQGLVSNDVDRIDEATAIYAALLTPQGKYLHDFFMIALEGGLVLDCEGGRADDLRRRLGLYRLKARVTIEDWSPRLVVAAAFGAGALEALGLEGRVGRARALAGGIVFVDPRLALAGARAVLPRAKAATILESAGLAPADGAAYDRHRLECALPDGSRDLMVEKALLLESGFEEMRGVSFEKGCYVGQELTARTKHRGLIKRRLVPVEIEGPAPAPGTALIADGAEVGEMRSSRDGLGFALVRLDALERAVSGGLSAGAARVVTRPLPWSGREQPVPRGRS